MSEHVEDPRHRRMHNCSRNDDTSRCRPGGTNTLEEIDAVSSTTCVSSPNESCEQPHHVAPPQEPCLLEGVSQPRRRPRSASASDTFLPTPPRRAALGSRRGDQIHADVDTDLGENTLPTDVSLSSITDVGGCSGSSTALKNTCVSSPSITVAAQSNAGLATAVFHGKIRPAGGVAEQSRHPHRQAHPKQNAVNHGGLAQQKRGPGRRVWFGIEAETPRASPHHPPWTTPPSSDCSYTYDIAATLADLLCRYLPQGPPLSPAAEGRPLPVADAGVCTHFLSVRWGRWGGEKATAAALPQSRPKKYRQSPTEMRSWLGGPPSPRSCPRPAPPQQLSPADDTHPHGLFKEHDCSSSSDRTTDLYVPHHLRPPRQHEHLWNLLTHYPRDASACLALGHGICAVLDIMREEPPPVLPTAVLHDIAASTATDINAFIHACEEAWEMASCASVKRPATVPRHVRGVDNATCRCGCLAAGQLLDVALYRFHLLYYLHHNRYPSPLQRQDTDDCRVAELLLGGARHDGERNALEEARAAVRGQPHAQRQSEQPPRRAPPARHDGLHVAEQAPEWESSHTSASLPPFGLSCVQTTSPTALLPLLALQTLSSFVGASSKRRSLAIGRRRRRWGLRAARGCGSHSSPTPLGSASTAAPRQGEMEKPPRGQPSPGDKSKSRSTDANHTDNYLYFCDETERLWAVMASVLLAWKQLEQCVSLSVFVPRLEVLQASSSHARRSTTLSPLARAAASMRLHHSAVEGMLLHAAYDSVSAATTRSFTACDTTFERTVVTRLRIRILSVVPTSRNGDDTCCMNDDVASSLRTMESFVYNELEGRIAQLPLWCAVAVEVLHLHIEQLRHNRTLLERNESAVNGGAVGRNDLAAWSSLHSSRAQQVVLLATRLMALICIFTDNTSALVSTAERTVSPAAPPCQNRSWRRTSPVDCGARASRERGDYSHSPSHDLQSSASVEATGNASATANVSVSFSAASAAQLSAVMYQHPLFGVAVAVVGGGVPLHWAEACVAPRAMSLGPLAVARSHPHPPVKTNFCDLKKMDVCSGGPSLAVVAAADAEAQAELRGLVQRIATWLREADGRP